MGRRHHSILPQLNRDSNSRKALFREQMKSLIENGKITTTKTKAMIVKRLFDKLVSTAKEGTLASRRRVIKTLGSAKSASTLIDTIVPVMTDRNSGFTTIKKHLSRRGDATVTATLSLIVAPAPKVAPAPAKEKPEVKEKSGAKKTK